jgi:hypothetical protein
MFRRKWTGYSEENNESKITRRTEANAKVEDGRKREGEGRDDDPVAANVSSLKLPGEIARMKPIGNRMSQLTLAATSDFL